MVLFFIDNDLKRLVKGWFLIASASALADAFFILICRLLTIRLKY